MQCDGLEPDIYSDYVLGTLAGSDLAELNSHLASDCGRCQAELSLSRRVWLGVAQAIPQVEPRRALRKRVIASVQDPERSGFRLAWWQPVAGLAALALAVFSGIQIGNKPPTPVTAPVPSADLPMNALVAENELLRKEIAQKSRALPVPSVAAPVPAPAPSSNNNATFLAQLAELRGQVGRAEQDLARQKDLLAAALRDKDELNGKFQTVLALPKPDLTGLERQLAAARLRSRQLESDVAEYRTLLVRARERLMPVQTAALLANPSLRLVRLRGTSRGSNMQGHVLVASGSQIVFYGSQLPPLPAGRAYQLWLIRGTVPSVVSAGVFQPSAQQTAMVQFTNPNFTVDVASIAVTEEPEGGSVTPTGHKLLIGS